MKNLKLPTESCLNKTFSKKDAIKNISYSMEILGRQLEGLQIIYEYESIISSISKTLDELSDNIINAGCSEDYVEAYKQWGDFGWSFNASINKKFFLNAPNSLQEADALMQEYCKSEEISKMMTELKFFNVNQKDLEEAYFSYINHKYKSSAMLLFSLIDSQLISRSFFTADGNYLKTGASAIGTLKKDEKAHKQNTHLHYLQFSLIIRCLLALFQNYKNFENEPSIINRNFLIHGMSKKEVNEIDCFKIWSALYSFVVIYPELEKNI